MIGLRIGAAELAEIEAGAPCVVLAPGAALPPAPPLVPLVLRDGVLARPGAAAGGALPLPLGLRPLALLSPAEGAAAGLLPLLPAGVPVVASAAALAGLLAGALREAAAALLAAEAARDRLTRALGTLAAPLPRLVLDLPPGPGAPASAPVIQPFGRPAEGLCTVELHLAAAGSGGLGVRLSAGRRVLAFWRLPDAALAPGWLALDLPEPAPPGPAEALLEVVPLGDDCPKLATAAGGGLALRAWTAPAGWSALPRHLDWAAAGTPTPGIPLPVPQALLAAAEVEGAQAALVAAGAEPARLLLDLPPGEAVVRLPAIPVGPADLLRLRLAAAPGVLAEMVVEVGDGPVSASVASGWRDADPAGAIGLDLPLPAGPMASVTLRLRNTGAARATVEVASLALASAAAGAPREAPPAALARLPPRGGVVLPDSAAIPAATQAPWHNAPPAPRLAAADPGGAVPAAPVPASAPRSAAGFQDVRLHQHLVNAEGTYRHLDVSVTGLVAGGGLWRQVRLKLFERRGTTGLEFREAKGWPQMFDVWPSAERDGYGPFWRLETVATAAALRALATPHDRALIGAVLEVLADIAAQGAATAGLPGPEREAWVAHARRLAGAVAAAR